MRGGLPLGTWPLTDTAPGDAFSLSRGCTSRPSPDTAAEPTSSLGSRTRIKTLTEQTRLDNARFFDDPQDVPRYCLTQGLGTIMDARHLVLVAQGERKARAVTALVEGPVTALFPGSVLQLHPHATVIVDEGAASALTLKAYYKDVFAGMPAWQRDPTLDNRQGRHPT